MNTNKIAELNESGFTVTKTQDVNTVIEHSKPFKLVREGKDDYAVPLNEDTNTYAVTIGGYPTNGEIDYNVVQYATPLIFEINESAKLAVAEEAKSTDNIEREELRDAVFEEIALKTEFYKSDDVNSARFVKIDETTYVKAGNTIGTSIELVAKLTDKVFVAEQFDDDIDSLSPEQKQDVVNHAPEGLSPDDFAEYVGHDLENIPGLESLDDQSLDALIQELSHMYFSK